MGRRRIGLAISDVSGTLARPLETLDLGQAGSLEHAVNRVASAVTALAAEEDGLATIVVGLPVGLDGTETMETSRVAAFITALRRRTSIPVFEEGERLTSREAEGRLATGERDWRKRKQRLDAVAAAVILQDYLDRRL